MAALVARIEYIGVKGDDIAGYCKLDTIYSVPWTILLQQLILKAKMRKKNTSSVMRKVVTLASPHKMSYAFPIIEPIGM